MVSRSLRSTGFGRLAVGPAALAYIAAAAALAGGPGRHTTYAGHSVLLAVITASAGACMLAIGYVILLFLPTNRLGPLAVAAGTLWFMPVWVGWEGGPVLVRTVAMMAAPLMTAVVLHVMLAYPQGRIATNAEWVLLRVLYAGFAFVGISIFFYNPFFDATCWANCTDNGVLIGDISGLSRVVRTVEVVLAGGGALLVVGLLCRRIVRSTRHARTMLAPVVPAAVLMTVATIGFAMVVHQEPVEDPTAQAFVVVMAVRCSGWLLLAAALLWAVIREVARHRSMRRLLASLGDDGPAGALQTTLAEATGDPALSVAYWLPEPGRYVDREGRAVPVPAPRTGRVLTTLVRDGRLVGVISSTDPDIDRLIGPAVRLGLENDVLRLQVRDQLDVLRSSRARIIERADLHRRHLERDLHDGAQSRLLGLLNGLRAAGESARLSGDDAAALSLDRCVDLAHTSLDELRTLARGLYPVSLEQGGLAGAVRFLAITADLPVEILGMVEGRFPSAVEIAGHRVLTEVIQGATARGASFVTVEIRQENQQLIVVLCDDGEGPIVPAVHLVDRVGAIDGTIASDRGQLKVVIPCG